jgi:hypothetical protein
VNSVDWSLGDQLVASASQVGDIVLHNHQSGVAVANFTAKNSQGLKMIKFSPFK